MSHTRALLLLATLLCLAGCASTGPMSPTAPPRQVSTLPPPPVPDSMISIPLHLDLGPLEASLNAQVPSDDDSGWKDTGKHILGASVALHTAWNRGPIQLGASGDLLSVRTDVAYKAQVGVGGGHRQLAECGWEEASPTLQVGLDVSLMPQSDWRIAPQVTAPQPVVGTHCKLTGLDFDVSDQIADALHKKFAASAANVQKQLAEKLDFKAQGLTTWGALNKPYALSDGSYLLLNPSRASLSPLVADKDGAGVSIIIGLVVHPEIAANTLPSTQTKPLPPLQAGGSGGLLHLVLPAEVTYASLDASLNQKYQGKILKVAGNPETVEKVDVYGSGQDLVIALTLQGKADGTFYLKGVPAYDMQSKTLYLDKLDFTLDTQNVVAKSAGWLLHGKLQAMLQADARADLSKKVDALQQTAATALNRPLGGGARLSGSLTSVGPEAFVLTDTGITAYMAAQATVQVSWE